MESDKYPKATFSGSYTEEVPFDKDGTYNITVKGKLTIHGVTQPVAADGTLEVKNGKVIAKSAFTVTPEQFEIEIPLLVRAHVAKIILIKVNAAYTPYLAKTPN